MPGEGRETIRESMRKHREMTKSGKISVWIGNLNSEDELLSYVDDGPFGRDYAFVLNANAGRELVAKTHQVLLSELVEEFSYSNKFDRSCIEMATKLGFISANCMVVLYAFEYIPCTMVNPQSPLKFVGAFDF